MAPRNTSRLMPAFALMLGCWLLQSAFVSPCSRSETALRGSMDASRFAVAGTLLTAPEAAHALEARDLVILEPIIINFQEYWWFLLPLGLFPLIGVYFAWQARGDKF
eukprot:TRINITY_DN2977_c0_g1_i1.p2 TRINITY_DN2977_c0_g1~~TRINITY_DN2977_c0_g1_i1.p2  ORF type:complete len:107 (+),score=17.50 TRINITY_DN2977_c0_g1_i1:79-399(+)